MKVDVYPNITNVEVYENPISVPVEATWEKVTFAVPDPVVATYDIGQEVAVDRDGDYVLQVTFNSTAAVYGEDFTLDGSVITWISPIPLEAGEELIVWYSPKTIYGSVPGSGEITSLNDLNDVSLAGPQAGQVLVRDGNGDFVNKFLNAGENVTITSNANGVTIAASSAGLSDGAQGTIQTSDGEGGFTSTNWTVANNNLIPTLDSEYDIGSPTNKVRDLYMSGNTIYLGDAALSLSGDTLNFTKNLVSKTIATVEDVAPEVLITSATFIDAVTGPQGPQGPQGIQGEVGPQGPQGLQGEVGPQGPQGQDGLQGIQGPQGLKGDKGDTGDQGPVGAQGPIGPQGLTGADGADGAVGPQGPQGPQGLAGQDGAVGPQGPQGDVGPQGPQGLKGDQGDVGPQGPQGEVGPQGPQGVAGQDGAIGPQGPQGEVGPQGPQGIQGPQGLQGEAGSGITFKGEVVADPSGNGVVTLVTAATFTPGQGDAVLSQTDDSLFIFDGADWVDGGSIQGPQGVQGPQGDVGAQGPQGEIGPQGPQGVAGQDGAIGPQGPQGDVGPQGPQGLQGPQGDQGIQGPQGEVGPQGPQGPAGQDGANGIDGVDGAQGPQGPQGASVTTLSITNTTVAATLSDNTSINGTITMGLNALSDVDITDTAHTLSDGYVLTYDSTHSHWHPEPVSSTAANIALDDLSDVDAANPSDSNALVYTGTNWTSQQVDYYTDYPNNVNLSTSITSYNITKDMFDQRKMIEVVGTRTSLLTLNLPEISTLKPNQSIRIYSISGLREAQVRLMTNSNDDYRYIYTTQGQAGVNYFDVETNGSFLELIVRESSINYPASSVKYYILHTNTASNIRNHEARVDLNAQDPTNAATPNVEINFITGDSNRWKVAQDGHIIPAANATYDIGEAENKVRHLYLSNNSIKFEGGDVGIDGDGDITFAKTGEAAVKLATQGFVTENAGGGSSTQVITTNLNGTIWSQNLDSLFILETVGAYIYLPTEAEIQALNIPRFSILRFIVLGGGAEGYIYLPDGSTLERTSLGTLQGKYNVPVIKGKKYELILHYNDLWYVLND